MLYQIQRASEILTESGEEAALKFAARLKCLGDYRDPIQKGYSASLRPELYRQMGENPENLTRRGVESLRSLIAANNAAK